MQNNPLTAKTLGLLAIGIGYLLSSAVNSHAILLTPTVDLTTEGAKGSINGALFYQAEAHPAGSGYGALNAFLKIQSNDPVESGYNTDYRYKDANGVPFTELDQITDHHTRALLLSKIPTIDIGGTTYREFLLDINEPAAVTKRYLSLDALQIFMGDGPDLHDYAEAYDSSHVVYDDTTYKWKDHATMIYDMDDGGDHWVGMDYFLNLGGSGWADAYVLIPETHFNLSSNDYVYLYSKFGEKWANDNNFEEWGVAASPVPEPASMLLFGSGLAGLGALLRRRQDPA